MQKFFLITKQGIRGCGSQYGWGGLGKQSASGYPVQSNEGFAKDATGQTSLHQESRGTVSGQTTSRRFARGRILAYKGGG